MEQFDQLLTCAICLDRYKTPKLLPCQHSYCMDPCMEGLVDYVKRQIKCPECRAEHRIPYNAGVQGLPTNFTLQKFLELHSKITGEMPDPNAEGIMLRCLVCQEKAYVFSCSHCDKKICADCKDAHCDMLKREITRISSQLKRSLSRVEDCVRDVDKNQDYLRTNAAMVVRELEENGHRLVSILQERTATMKRSVEAYLETESAALKDVKRNLSTEVANIQSNCEVIDKYLLEGKWDDNELMDCKEIFLKMMDFVRNYDPGFEEYSRRIRLVSRECVDDVAKRLLTFSEVKFHDPKKEEEELARASFHLSRSKSDHRLVSELRAADKSPTLPRRRFGETRTPSKDDRKKSLVLDDDEDEDARLRPGSRFRSRFLRPEDERSGREEAAVSASEEKTFRQKVVDTEDISRGPLSGCIRLADSSRIIQRIKELEIESKNTNSKPKPAPPVEVKRSNAQPIAASSLSTTQQSHSLPTASTLLPPQDSLQSSNSGDDEYEYYTDSEEESEPEPARPARRDNNNSFIDKYLSASPEVRPSWPRPALETAASASLASSASAPKQPDESSFKHLSKSKSSHVLGLSAPERSQSKERSGDNLSSWAQYLKAKYSKKGSSAAAEKSNALVFGSRGSKQSEFTWPRGVAVGPRDTIVVADSSNHRVQVFDRAGRFVSTFGSYGNGEAEFDCLAGVHVTGLGHYVIADRYNHRVQMFDSNQRFVRAFGSTGASDGAFNYPWGVTSDKAGFIYVCDKENHRVQIFQPDGSFVGKFGCEGADIGQLQHPHYVAVNRRNHVVVSDSNNHRVQVFDVSGRVIGAFGGEGTEPGQLKFPRGIALDEDDNVYVADSGNNRIQVFAPDGQRIRCFGKWGGLPGEFKGLEGIAVNARKDVIVADRENHRVQIFHNK